MSVLTQANLDASQKGLRDLINMTGAAHAECCERGLTAERDKLRKVQAHLMMAEAEAGDLSIAADEGVISTRGGGNK
jgi:hypothetical protein